MASSLTSLSARIEKAAEVLKLSPDALSTSLEQNGVTNDASGLRLLDASITTADMLESILKEGCAAQKGALLIKAAASFLKGVDPFEKSEPVKPAETPATQGSAPATDAIVELIKANKPVQSMKDRELLELYVKDRDYEMEQELNRRAKGQAWVILKKGKFEPGKEEIDIEESLELLKASRKRTNPTILPVGDTVVPVYRITELNINDRLIEICPFCGETLYKGYCQKCSLSFSGVGDDERAYVKLIVDGSSNFSVDSFSDRRAVHVSALKGIDDLKKTWPSIALKFDELKATNSLPKLRTIMNRPSTAVADPYHVDGQRTFGNRSY